jgi:3-oxoadipate enol-lactonase
MNLANVGGVDLEYSVHGHGEPVLLIQPGVFADWFTPLLREPALATGYRLVHYHRVGSAGSSRVQGPVTLQHHATHGRKLLEHLGITRAHVVGHSSSGNIALQMAVDHPDIVHSLSVLEPALMAVPSAPRSRAFLGTAVQKYRDGDRAAAIDIFLSGTCGPDYRAPHDRALPRAFEQAVADAAMFFEQELPALQQWSFGSEDARRITQPALAIVGARSLEMDPIWGERHRLLLEWLPHAESTVLGGTTHLLQVENPRGVAESLAAFFARHPIAAD